MREVYPYLRGAEKKDLFTNLLKQSVIFELLAAVNAIGQCFENLGKNLRDGKKENDGYCLIY